MELHEFLGAGSLPSVALIKHVFLKITKPNLTYLCPANSFFPSALLRRAVVVVVVVVVVFD